MSEKERTGSRDLTYSRWHRTDSLKRFLDVREAFACKVIDIDWCEYCGICKAPLALVETKESRTVFDANITSALARLAGVQAFTVSYWRDGDDIGGFLVRRLVPEVGPIREMSPPQYAEFLYALRLHHDCSRAVAA